MQAKEIKYRKYKRIDMDEIRMDIAVRLCMPLSGPTLENYNQSYDNILSQILDRHAPVLTKVLTEIPNMCRVMVWRISAF